MATDISKWPLLVLMEHFNAWIASARSPALWNPEADHQSWTDSLRGEAKEVVVWLELRGLDEAVSQLEERMVAFRAAVWEFQHACPAHADKKPSLSGGLGEDGKALLHCHA